MHSIYITMVQKSIPTRVTVTSNNVTRLTIKKPIAELYGWKAGDTVYIIATPQKKRKQDDKR